MRNSQLFRGVVMMKYLLLLILSLCVVSVYAQTGSGLSMAIANKMVLAAAQQCENDGYKVSVAVVDKGGVVLAQVRMDGAGVHTIESSFRKAYTSASVRMSTQKLAQIAAKDPELQGLHRLGNNILILGGGLPITLNGEVIGGIGVGGAPGIQFDEVCAEAGLKVFRN